MAKAPRPAATVVPSSTGNGASVATPTEAPSVRQPHRPQITPRGMPARLQDARFTIGDAIVEKRAAGETALFDAIDEAVTLTDRAEGDPRSTRAVVVLSDGAATTGGCLDDLITMTTTDEDDITEFCAQEGQEPMTASRAVPVDKVRGIELRVPHEHPVQIFFLGFGEADLHIGRLLAEATGAEYQGSAGDDLAAVIEQLSGYF